MSELDIESRARGNLARQHDYLNRAQDHSKWYAKHFGMLSEIIYRDAFEHGRKHGFDEGYFQGFNEAMLEKENKCSKELRETKKELKTVKKALAKKEEYEGLRQQKEEWDNFCKENNLVWTEGLPDWAKGRSNEPTNS